MKTKLKRVFSWLDDHFLLVISGFLIAFIPLYPKIPLFEAIPGYIVRVRLEDLLVLFASFVWLVQVLRHKVRWKTPIFALILVYVATGVLSVLSAVFLTKTVPLELIHVGKTALHLFRYLEYFSLFLITFSAIKSKKDANILVNIFAFTIVVVSIYGYGQKYYYWPVFSTMNREFSKGVVLYLTEHARVQSTFGGHYDLAAFLVISLNLVLAIAFKQKNKWLKTFYYGVHLLGLWLLIMTASRTSFIAYLFGALSIIWLIAKEKTKIKEQLKWGLSRTALLVFVTLIMMFSFGADMSARFLHVLQGYPQVTAVYQNLNDYRKQAGKFVLVAVGLKERDIQPPQDGIGVGDLDEVLTPSDQRPIDQKPADVYVDVPITVKIATQSADGTTYMIDSEQGRTWSENALKYGLSTAIRLDALWPNAIKGFLSNPLLGSGYATLNKEGVFHFTEAESTDNNFLRTLGETGLLGFISFYGIVFLAIHLAYKFYQAKKGYASTISIGFIGASLGLLLNATYIDVFAASKVAFTYWALTGVVMAVFYLDSSQKQFKCQKLIEWIESLKKHFSHEN